MPDTTLAQIAASLKPADSTLAPAHTDRCSAGVAERNCLITILASYSPKVQREIWWTDMFTTNSQALSTSCDRLDPNLPCFENNKSARIRILVHALNWINEIAEAYIYRTAVQEQPAN